MACPTGASQAPERFSALRPPLDAGERSKVASPGRRHAPREREWLFDIVRWKLPKTVRRRAASSALVVPAEARTHNHGLWLWVPALRPLRGRRPGRRSFIRRRTNLRLWEMVAGDIPLFPDCYLQWIAQLQRVEP